MKRNISFFVLMMLVVSIIIPAFSADAMAENSSKNVANNREILSNESAFVKASDDTIETAKIVISKLVQEKVFSLYIDRSLEQLYATSKWVAPEMNDFEKRKDASISLIELYEEMLTNLHEYDLDVYITYCSNFSENNYEKNNQYTGYIVEVNTLFGIRETIEALLAVDCYYNLLDEKQVHRMIEDFKEFAVCEYSSVCKTYGDTEYSTLFEKYRANRGVTYSIGTTVYTTSGRAVTTLSASQELSTMEINNCRSAYENQSGYSDISYVSSATSFYNCHSYAWYNTSPGRKWIDHTFTFDDTYYYGVERFIFDNHCTSLGNSDNSAQINDIIVYWVDGEVAHSGIVVGINPIRIRSKWGQGCVWEHSKSTVPPSYKDSGVVNVTYYRYARSHDYRYIDYGNTANHKCECVVCGFVEYCPHNWVAMIVHSSNDENDVRYRPQYCCSKCGAITINPAFNLQQ